MSIIILWALLAHFLYAPLLFFFLLQFPSVVLADSPFAMQQPDSLAAAYQESVFCDAIEVDSLCVLKISTFQKVLILQTR